jgi:hypothetical protein
MANLLFEGCCYDGYQYFTDEASWIATGGTATTGLTYHFSGDPAVPDGCYTIVSAFTSGFTSVSFTNLDGVYTTQTGCTDTLCLGTECCSNDVCVNISLSAYSGISGDYVVAGSYNTYPYWTGSTDPGYLFYNGTNWCLSDSLGGTCYFYGSNPTTNICPDLDESIYYNSPCVPVPTPVDPCANFEFDLLVECEIPVPTPTPTPTITPTPTPTPTPTVDICSAFTASVSFSSTTAPLPTPTPTPSPTATFPYNITSGVTFVIDDGYFTCITVRKLIDCENGNEYLVSNPLVYINTEIQLGTTFLALMSDGNRCVTYTEDIFGSPSDYVISIVDTFTGDCSTCVVPIITPTPTPTPTPTVTPTPTPTPTVTYPAGTSFIFTSCTSNTMIIQNQYPPLNIVNGSIIQDLSGNCYTYIGNYINYVPPTGFLWTNANSFTATTATTYVSCLSCLTPAPTATPTYLKYVGRGEFGVACPVCELTNGGTEITFYTEYTTLPLQTGDYVYEDSSLTTPIILSYIKYGGKIYSVDPDGQITQFCIVNGNC